MKKKSEIGKEGRLPDFLIVGAMKAGTSTLAAYLDLHPKIHIPKKEIHFFDNNQNFDEGIQWYAEALTNGIKKNTNSVLIGEKTPTYSYKPECAERIRNLIPNVKIIWIFRDPVNRTYSNYLHAKKQGAEFLSFSGAIDREETNTGQKIYQNYIDRSIYVKQIERFLNFFSKEQMCFLLYEKLISDPKSELDKVTNFLNIKPFPNTLPEIYSNPTRMPLFPFSLWLFREVFGGESFFFKVVCKLNYLFVRKKPKLSEDIKLKLRQKFNDYNVQLGERTGLDLKIWD